MSILSEGTVPVYTCIRSAGTADLKAFASLYLHLVHLVSGERVLLLQGPVFVLHQVELALHRHPSVLHLEKIHVLVPAANEMPAWPAQSGERLQVPLRTESFLCCRGPPPAGVHGPAAPEDPGFLRELSRWKRSRFQ